jgi:hypothetical protein
MGLTIHYKFNAGERSTEEVRQLIKSLHQAAKDLAFEQLDEEIIEFTGAECTIPENVEGDRWFILKLSAIKRDIYNFDYEEYPVHIIGFTALPRPGTEELDIFLCRYPDSFEWIAQSRCKTQYASLPEYGGDANFVLAHTMIIALLDKAQELGILEEVVDEAGYWSDRNPHKLIAEGERWNKLILEVGKILRRIPNTLRKFFN